MSDQLRVGRLEFAPFGTLTPEAGVGDWRIYAEGTLLRAETAELRVREVEAYAAATQKALQDLADWADAQLAGQPPCDPLVTAWRLLTQRELEIGTINGRPESPCSPDNASHSIRKSEEAGEVSASTNPVHAVGTKQPARVISHYDDEAGNWVFAENWHAIEGPNGQCACGPEKGKCGDRLAAFVAQMIPSQVRQFPRNPEPQPPNPEGYWTLDPKWLFALVDHARATTGEHPGYEETEALLLALESFPAQCVHQEPTT